MSQGALVKRQKRTLLNFQENFLIPLVRKSAFRYMQFDPDNYPVQDYTFIPFSSLGAMAREYEVAQLSQILQVIPADSPCLLYTSPSPRDGLLSRMPSSA